MENIKDKRVTPEKKIGEERISIVIIAKNEEARIEDALKSARWADEIVVVDDMSTDRTVEIARKYTDKIFTRKMVVEGRHRNWANSQATGDWVISIDCDERITPELAKEIRETVNEEGKDYEGFNLPIKSFIGKRWIRYGGYYPAAKLRMFRKGALKYDEDQEVHPRVYFKGKTKTFKGDVEHYHVKDFTHYLRKFNRETSLEAKKWVIDKRKISFPKVLRKMSTRFIKYYFMAKGYKDGILGLVMCHFHGFYQLISYFKYREMIANEG